MAPYAAFTARLGAPGSLTAAAAATRRGITVELVERQASLIANGTGITLYPNGERALRELGIDAAVVGAGRRITTIRAMAPDGTVLADLPAERWDGIGGTISI